MTEELVEPVARDLDSSEESIVPQQPGRGERRTGNSDEERAFQGDVLHLPERWDPAPAAELESPAADDGRDSAQPTATEQVREVGYLDRLGAGPSGDPGDGERGRHGGGRAHPESLAHREFVTEMDEEPASPGRPQAVGHLGADRNGDAEVAGDAERVAGAGAELGLRERTQFQRESRTDRTACARISRLQLGSKNAGDVGRRERDCTHRPLAHHEKPLPVLRLKRLLISGPSSVNRR